MRVLVTGANGFVGINIVKQLLIAGYEVVCTHRAIFDQASFNYLSDFKTSLIIEKLDITDYVAIQKLLEKYKLDRIIHAAGITPTNLQETYESYNIMDINLMGTVRLLNAAIDNHISRFVYVGSDGIYSQVSSNSEIVTEEHPTNLSNLYGIAKNASEKFCARLQHLTGIETCSGRVCATYGPMERPTNSRQNMSAIYLMAEAAFTGKTLRVKGLEVQKNWTYIDDIARAFVALIGIEKLSYSTYNISNGCAYSLQEVLDVFTQVEPRFSYQVVPENEAADISYNLNQQRGILDISRLRDDIGYHPVNTLESGIQEYLSWLKNYRSF